MRISRETVPRAFIGHGGASSHLPHAQGMAGHAPMKAISMKKLALAVILSTVCIMPAYCQSAPVDRLKIEVTRAELQLIGQGLMKLPYEAAAPILGNLQKQLNDIDAAAKAAVDAAKPKPPEKPAE
jgi:hypothetical protein